MPDPIAAAVEEIRADRAHGSRRLARRAVEALAGLADAGDALTPASLQAAARALAEARPAMAVIRNAVGRVYVEAAEAAGERGLAAALRDRADAWLTRWEWSARDLAEHARGVVGGTVGTISLSHTVIHVLKARRAEVARVVVGAGHPGLDGRAAAGELAAAGLAVTLAPDGAVPSLLEDGAVVVIGADAVLASGAVVNRAGTFPLAAAAARLGLRCYVLAETLKVTDRPFVPEEADPAAVVPEPPPGVQVRNPLFDRTRPDLIEGYITEDGLRRAADLEPYVARARRYGEALGFLPGQ